MRLHRSCETEMAYLRAQVADLTAERDSLRARLLPVDTAFQLGREFGQREGEGRAASRKAGLRLVAG